MWSQVLGWLSKNSGLLSVVGGLFIFLLYDWRKKSLEITKLQLEVRQLRDETRIYRPTQKEIEDILKDISRIASQKLQAWGANEPLEYFGVRLSRFLVQLSAFYGDASARTRIAEERLYASIHHLPDPYGVNFAGIPFPDVKELAGQWELWRASVSEQLAPETVKSLDVLLIRLGARRVPDSVVFS